MAKNLGIKIYGPAQSINAFGYYTREIALALYDAGLNTQLIDTTQPNDFKARISGRDKELLSFIHPSQGNPIDRNYVAIHINSPEKINFVDNEAQANIAWTGVDTDDLPLISAMVLSNPRISQVWVPGSWQKDVFDKYPALKVKTKMVNFGVNNVKSLNAKSQRFNILADDFKFCFVGSLKPQDGADVLLKAFYEEFKNDENVSLFLKLFLGTIEKQQEKEVIEKYVTQFKGDSKAKVAYITGLHVEGAVDSIIGSSDCLVSPARGKHWNNSVLRAMASQVPVIVNNLAGNRQYTNPENSFPVSSKKAQITNMEWLMNNPIYQGASWFEPNIEDLKKQMRAVYNLSKSDPKALYDIALKGKNKAIKLDWTNTAMDVLKNIKQYEPK